MKTPNDLLKLYEDGFPGAECDVEDTEKLLTSLPRPLFGDCSDQIVGSGKGKISLPYKCIQIFEPEFGEYERQVTGDCVSHGARNAIDVSRTVEIIDKKENESYSARGATEGIYGSRGHTGEGMTCSQAARFVSTQGGILLRKKYPSVDLSVYNGHMASRWGRSGTPRSLVEAAKANPVKTVSLIRTVAEARDALANGYGLNVCSNVGFNSRRDKNGISRRKGSWGHAMAWIGMDDTRERDNGILFLVQNSWGLWNAGPRVLGQPNGSFWITEGDAASMLSQNGSFVFSSVVGFPPQKVDWSSLKEVF